MFLSLKKLPLANPEQDATMRSVLAHIMLMHGRWISECIFAGPFLWLSVAAVASKPDCSARTSILIGTETREWHSYATIRDIPSQDNEGKRELMPTSKCESEKPERAADASDSHVHSESDPEQWTWTWLGRNHLNLKLQSISLCPMIKPSTELAGLLTFRFTEWHSCTLLYRMHVPTRTYQTWGLWEASLDQKFRTRHYFNFTFRSKR